MQRCGFCCAFSGIWRRAMCIGSRRGSSESYYRELGDQDTLKIEDKASDLSDDSEDGTNMDRQSDTIPPPEPDPDPPDPADSELANLTPRNLHTGRFLTMHKRRKKRLVTRSLDNETALLDDLNNGQVQCILDQSAEWKFNAFTLETVSGGRCLPVLCIHLFHVYGLISHFNLDVTKAWKLFSLIEEGYHSTNPYHNSVHAADVTQAMHCFLQQKQILEHMEPLEIMASLLAAIAHDMDHPGVNQPFLIATSNHLAALYRNTSVLENHHWRSAVSCLIESGLLDQMQDQRRALEQQISSLILATDITRQQEYLSQFKGYLDTKTLDLTRRSHRHLVLQIALKCADISNPCRPWEISRKWSLKVCDEFFRQGDYERRLNLPVTALCDRHTNSIPKIQTGFFKFVVTPLISEWHRFLKNDLSALMIHNLLHNQSKWEVLMAQEIADETRTELSEADLIDDEVETASDSNLSASSEMLLPPRRSSLNPTRPISFKGQLRRFSVPLNVFQDTRVRNKSRDSSETSRRSPIDSEHSIHSQLSVRGYCDFGASTSADNHIFTTERLLPNSSITSITTPIQATRLNTVLKGGITWKLVRQQTFPPLETSARMHALTSRSLFISNEESIYRPRYSKAELARREKFCRLFRKFDPDRPDDYDYEFDYGNRASCSRYFGHENSLMRDNENVTSGQLRRNLTAASLEYLASGLNRRRKSMPAKLIVHLPNDNDADDGSSDIPGTSQEDRILYNMNNRRRGSAPSPMVHSEIRGMITLSFLRQTVLLPIEGMKKSHTQ